MSKLPSKMSPLDKEARAMKALPGGDDSGSGQRVVIILLLCVVIAVLLRSCLLLEKIAR